MAAFSLVEIILALGVISFAIVAILGMFPVAVRAAADSQQETQAALIARSIFQQLQTQTGSTRFFTTGDLSDSSSQTQINLGSAGTKTAIARYDADGGPLADAGGTSGASYTVDAVIAPVAATPGLTQVTLTVKTVNRTEYPFTTLLRL